MLRPCFHEWSSLFQKVGTVICRLDLILYGVSQRTFSEISSIAVFAGPIPETGTEAVSGRDAVGCITLGFNAAQKSG
ncbi:hypothetical protein WK60_10900 [Burkholderia ubonensis]|uniref:Uncharacterized protein n=1 Tax=Burkholderia ubonensis TaxID=101571 RepID=A0AAU8UD95_9BURK|nr:hypothetical protein WK67_08145 [Burkholderia ubonensis]KVT94558.1 hypothetical protein WK60_10900 [Burkholderia ubonensis]